MAVKFLAVAFECRSVGGLETSVGKAVFPNCLPGSCNGRDVIVLLKYCVGLRGDS